MDKNVPDEGQAWWSLIAAQGDTRDAAFVAAIWAKESNFTWRPTGDHGPAQLTSWWKDNHPELILPQAYDPFGRPKDHKNRQRKFTGDVYNNLLTLGNIVRFQRQHHAGDEGRMAAYYGPDPQPNWDYAKQIGGWYVAYQPFFTCMLTGK